jgi:hypothetical protein
MKIYKLNLLLLAALLSVSFSASAYSQGGAGSTSSTESLESDIQEVESLIADLKEWLRRKKEEEVEGSPSESDQRIIKTRIWRSSSVNLTNAMADKVLANMSRILYDKDSPNDVSTKVRFVRDGNVQILPVGVPDVIYTQQDFHAVKRVGNGIKIVRSLRWCGRPLPTAIGCAEVGINEINVVAEPASNDDVVWVHEYGHNCGLNHRDDDSKAVMFPMASSSMRVVSESESLRFSSGPLESIVAIGDQDGSGGDRRVCADCDVTDESGEAPMPVEEFVKIDFIHGVPFSYAQKYGLGDAEKLLAMLRDFQANDDHLSKIVTVLCFIAEPSTKSALIDFINNKQISSENGLEAKNAALIHLGDFAAQTGDVSILGFLASIAKDANKQTEGLAEASFAALQRESLDVPEVSRVTQDAVKHELSTSASMGIALSGFDNAEELLKSIGEDPSTPTAVEAMIPEALETAEKVKKVGIQGFREGK